MTPKSPATSVSISTVCGAVVPKKVLKIIEPHANHALKACIDDDYDNNDDCNWLFLPCFTALILSSIKHYNSKHLAKVNEVKCLNALIHST